MKNVYRVEIKATNTFGWQVRTHKGGKDNSKWFADSKYGSAGQALVKAEAYRDALMTVLAR